MIDNKENLEIIFNNQDQSFQSLVQLLNKNLYTIENNSNRNFSNIIHASYVDSDTYEYLVGDIGAMLDTLEYNLEYSTAVEMDTLFADIADIIPQDQPNYGAYFETLIGQLEAVTRNQVEIASSARENTKDMIDAITSAQADTSSEELQAIETAINNVAGSISDNASQTQDFISTAFQGIADGYSEVADAIITASDDAMTTVENAIDKIPDIFEKLWKELLDLLRELFSLDPAQILESVKKAYEYFTAAVDSIKCN